MEQTLVQTKKEDSKITITIEKIYNLKVATFNVANAFVDEASVKHNFYTRLHEVVQQIEQIDADILAINELRPFLNQETKEIEYPIYFLSKLKKYTPIIGYNNASSLSMGNAILYKRARVFPVKQVFYWLSETPEIPSDSWGNGFGRTLMGAKFMIVDNDKINLGIEPIWAYVTHFGLGESEKFNCVKNLPKIIQKDTNGDKFVAMGDFNFFDDKEGEKQREILREAMLNDVCKEARFSFDPSQKSYGTFLGFENDLCLSSWEELIGGGDKIPSRLDHIWSSHDLETRNPLIYAQSSFQIIKRETPSDHLPISCEIMIKPKLIEKKI